MDNDYYRYVEQEYALIGERTGKVFRLGDAARVLLTKVNPEERTIDFVLVTDVGVQAAGSKRPSARKPIGGKRSAAKNTVAVKSAGKSSATKPAKQSNRTKKKKTSSARPKSSKKE